MRTFRLPLPSAPTITSAALGFARLLALALGAICAGCSRREAPAGATPPPALRISQRNEPADLDPALAALPDDFFIIRALSEGLVIPGTAGAPAAPAAADSWEVDPDGLTWTFHLREDGRWSNGEPVTASDFVESYRRLLSPQTPAPKADLLFVVKNARAFAQGRVTDFAAVGFLALGPHRLSVTLERPTPFFLDYAASGPWIPVNPRVVSRLGHAWTRPGNFVGNGPFILTEWNPEQRIVVRKNPLYHGAKEVRLAEIQFVRFDADDTEEMAYRAREIDVTMNVPYSKIGVYARDRPQEFKRSLLSETRYLAFNLARKPLGDLRVRLALSMAVDRKLLVADVLRGGQQPAFRLLPPGVRLAGEMASDLVSEPYAEGSADQGDARTRSARHAEARRLLAAAGYPEGRGFPRLELSGWSRTPVLEAIQAMWKTNLGIDVDVAVRDARLHEAALRRGRYDVAFMTIIPDIADPLLLLERFRSGAALNYPRWADDGYDARLEEAARQTDPVLEAALLREAESRLVDQAPVAPLYFNARNCLMRPYVHGWSEDALWTRDYRGVYLGN